MNLLYLPTIDHSLWPVGVFFIVLVPLSLWHERNWRATLAAYGHARMAAGATDESWPDAETRFVLGVQPWLVLTVAALLAATVAVTFVAVAMWPRTPPGFDMAINYYDRPYLGAMLVAGLATVVAAVAVALDLRRAPFSGVANELRRCVYASAEERASRFQRALACDPGVPRRSADEAVQPAGAPRTLAPGAN